MKPHTITYKHLGFTHRLATQADGKSWKRLDILVDFCDDYSVDAGYRVTSSDGYDEAFDSLEKAIEAYNNLFPGGQNGE